MSAILGTQLIDIWNGPAPPPVKSSVEVIYRPGQATAAAKILPNQSTSGEFEATRFCAWADAHTIADGYRALIGTIVALVYRGANYGNVLVTDASIVDIRAELMARGIHPDNSAYAHAPAGRIVARFSIVRLA
jgi:hypothetical protein